MYEACDEDEATLRDPVDRIVEYEKKLATNQHKPLLAAMFMLYFAISIALISLFGYWLFY